MGSEFLNISRFWSISWLLGRVSVHFPGFRGWDCLSICHQRPRLLVWDACLAGIYRNRISNGSYLWVMGQQRRIFLISSPAGHPSVRDGSSLFMYRGISYIWDTGLITTHMPDILTYRSSSDSQRSNSGRYSSNGSYRPRGSLRPPGSQRSASR